LCGALHTGVRTPRLGETNRFRAVFHPFIDRFPSVYRPFFTVFHRFYRFLKTVAQMNHTPLGGDRLCHWLCQCLRYDSRIASTSWPIATSMMEHASLRLAAHWQSQWHPRAIGTSALIGAAGGVAVESLAVVTVSHVREKKSTQRSVHAGTSTYFAHHKKLITIQGLEDARSSAWHWLVERPDQLSGWFDHAKDALS
jgi:hypothetical protein